MTTATFTLPRETVVLDGGESTAPLPVTVPAPLAAPERDIPARELLAKHGIEVKRSYGQHRELREPWSPWLKLAVYAVLVPLLFATLALLTGCTPEPLQDGPVTPVSGDSPDPTRPFVPAWVAGDMPALGEFPIGGAP